MAHTCEQRGPPWRGCPGVCTPHTRTRTPSTRTRTHHYWSCLPHVFFCSRADSARVCLLLFLLLLSGPAPVLVACAHAHHQATNSQLACAPDGDPCRLSVSVPQGGGRPFYCGPRRPLLLALRTAHIVASLAPLAAARIVYLHERRCQLPSIERVSERASGVCSLCAGLGAAEPKAMPGMMRYGQCSVCSSTGQAMDNCCCSLGLWDVLGRSANQR